MKALIFDLDGTLIDSVYAHTLAWQKAFGQIGIESPAWAIHRRIGMSGRLLAKAVAREHGRELSDAVIKKLDEHHGALFHELAPKSPPLPGARELIAFLNTANVAYGIATSGKVAEVQGSLEKLGLSESAVIVDGDMVASVKPEPDLFVKCHEMLEVERSQCLIVGDAIWDIHAARRSGILGVGLLSGGFGEQELYNAGAMRVYKDAAALLAGIDELGLT
jgi:HAD superfamily hydrolase (TIGR01509 family)